MSPGSQQQRVNVLGVGVSPVNMAEAVATMEAWIEGREKHYVCVTGVHGVIESQRDSRLREIHNKSGMTVPDGMPLVWLSRSAGHRNVSRVYGPDLMLAFCEASARHGHRHFLYGGEEGVADALGKRLEERFPSLVIAGTYCPPFRQLTAEEDADIVALINASRSDVVWVGLSTPKQERWMAEHRDALDAPVLVGVGAAFDFHTGRKKQAPAWMQRSGLEWLFRLLQEPRRLGRRYLINNPTFVSLLAMQRLGLKRYESPWDAER